MEKELKVGYELAIYENNGVKTEYKKYYILVGNIKVFVKPIDTTAKSILTDYLEKK